MSRATGARRPATPKPDILVQSRRWAALRGARPVILRAIDAAATALPAKTGEVAVVLTHDKAMRVLNRTWRGKDAPTNVLSFPAVSPGGGRTVHLGDIVIAYETTAREAKAEGKPFRDHLAHLVVHGFLHLAGHDHMTEREAEAMESLEIAILKRLKVPNPYIARAGKG
jgi:probable rRNA maturation factor